MTWIKVYNSLKSFVKSLIVAIFIFLFLEFGFRLLDLDVGVRERFSDEEITTIYGSENLSDYRLVIEEQGKPWIYKPLVEFIEVPRDGKFVSVSKDNIRCNENGDDTCLIKSGQKVIWMFGGSTMFGYGVKNDETIPSFLDSMLPEYSVINFGQAAYYSTLENILLNSYMSQGIMPEIIVFLDGLNDYYFYETPDRSVASDSINDRLSNNIETFSNSNKFITLAKKIARNFDIIVWTNKKLRWFSKSNKNIGYLRDDEIIKKVGKRIEFNFRTRVIIGEANNIKVINVLQPIPSFGIGHATSLVPDEIISIDNHINAARGYAILDKKKLGKLDDNFIDLTLLEIKEPMYIDTVHYSPQMNKKIASILYDFLISENKIEIKN